VYHLSFYTFGDFLSARNLPWLTSTVLVAALILVVLRRTEVAGALTVLSAPLLALVAGSLRGAGGIVIRGRGVPLTVCVVALVVPLIWLAAAWAFDVRKTRFDQIRQG
jgi:hypothetical protein